MARILATLAVLFAIGFAQDAPAAESSETPEDSPSADVAAPIDIPEAPAPEEPIAAAPVEPEAPEPEPVVAAPIATQPPPVAPAAPIATPAPVAPVAPVAPAAPAAPVSGNPAVVEIPEAPEGLEGDNLITYHREAYLSALASANIIGSKGCWLYGDYINGVPNIRDPVNCARACESDEKCYHWNFQVMSKRCDFKAENGGVNRDISDWITGDAVRYLTAPPIVP
ncbi:unnamed protein product [Cladocopium goreaui]|uniref:Apple domain-containing protein n=1 Tax=Cladocopium goreaui TaxID=2562237 RepID=A0A9P1D4W5_9DINO|nr:unnamed protein product [Cladocopium goreaui]|mmetsp:Transcript_15915/g.35082  ORF Transcript_15915/g.35082 Transcript_15915/m.35082 type:complete len:225 (+) Transcript_15915:89-763(+)